ncbi:hypothetical protein [Microbacterium abyssi]|uniref:hypothetical protein n=1 Tax=Microbacterium abyssi TaxID=2782166 RepID=UPI001E3B0767|nr:hypothetical protein [Microbacterium sp. A18JL241]
MSDSSVRSPVLATAAAVVLAIEGAALTIFAVIELFGLGAGEAVVLPTAVALIVLTLIGAVALFAFAFGTRRGRTWARSGAVVLQVLAIALALASFSVQPVPWIFILGVGLPGLVGFVLLIAASRREGRAETAPEVEAES